MKIPSRRSFRRRRGRPRNLQSDGPRAARRDPITGRARLALVQSLAAPQSAAPPLAAWRLTAVLAWAMGCSALVAATLRLPGAAWWAMGLYHLGCGAAIAIAGRARRPPSAAQPPAPARPSSIVPLAAIAGASCAATVLAGALAAPLIDWTAAAGLWKSWGLEPPGDRMWLLYYASVNPWVEERFWRGTLLGPGVRGRVGPRGARLLTVAAFVAHHAVVLIPSFGAARGALLCAPILLAGAVWTWMHERTGRLGWCIASHVGADAGLVVLYLLGARG